MIFLRKGNRKKIESVVRPVSGLYDGKGGSRDDSVLLLRLATSDDPLPLLFT